MPKKKYVIPCSWTMDAEVVVYADSLDEAVAKVEDGDLPHGSYLEGSFAIHEEYMQFLNKGVDGDDSV